MIALGLLVLAGGGCGKTDVPTGPGQASGAPQGPPPVPDASPGRIAVTLGDRAQTDAGAVPGEVSFPLDPAQDGCRIEWLKDGLRLRSVDPATADRADPAWGCWVFADGPLVEDAVLLLRTGTRFIINGESWAPIPERAGSDGSRLAVSGKLVMGRVDRETRTVRATLSGVFSRPGQKDGVPLRAGLSFPLP